MQVTGNVGLPESLPWVEMGSHFAGFQSQFWTGARGQEEFLFCYLFLCCLLTVPSPKNRTHPYN